MQNTKVVLEPVNYRGHVLPSAIKSAFDHNQGILVSAGIKLISYAVFDNGADTQIALYTTVEKGMSSKKITAAMRGFAQEASKRNPAIKHNANSMAYDYGRVISAGVSLILKHAGMH